MWMLFFTYNYHFILRKMSILYLVQYVRFGSGDLILNTVTIMLLKSAGIT